MRKALICFILLCSCAEANENKISGAFGIKLGDTFDSASAISKVKSDKVKAYLVKPSKKMRNLGSYRVSVTPITNLIYSIAASQEFENNNQCIDERTIIKEHMIQKYDKSQKLGASLHDRLFPGSYYFKDNDRDVFLDCRGSKKNVLILIYTDSQLEGLSQKEHAQIKEQ